MSDYLSTRQDIREWIQSQLSVGAGSSQFTPTRVNIEINNAYLWACSKFNWKNLERTKSTSTKAGLDYYDYPPKFRLESINRLEIDGLPYNKKDYDDFLEYRRINPTDTSKRIFANHDSFYFVFPTPTADGNKNLDVRGFENPNPMALDTDKTIFSDSDPDANRAIAKQALATLKAKGKDKKQGQIEDAEALNILASIYNKALGSRQTEQQLDQPAFDVPDYFK